VRLEKIHDEPAEDCCHVGREKVRHASDFLHKAEETRLLNNQVVEKPRVFLIIFIHDIAKHPEHEFL